MVNLNKMWWGDADDIAPKLGFNGYVFMAILFSFFFVIQHLVLHTILRITYQGYMRLTLKERHEYRMQWNAFFHAIFATWFSIYCAFYTCGDGKTFFNDEQCRLVPHHVLKQQNIYNFKLARALHNYFTT